MKKQILVTFLFLLFLLKIQTLSAQSGSVLSLPGGTVTTSKMALPRLNTLITAYPFTVEMWVKPSSITAAGGFWVDRSGSDVSLQFTNDATGGLRNDIFGTNTNATVLANVKPALNVWHHLSLIARSDSVLVECDGIFYAALNTKTFLTTFCSKYSHIGVDSSANNSTRTVTGLFDEIRIWNTARTRDEIRTNNSTILNGTETGLVAYYNFENNNANDKTTNALNATVTGGFIAGLNTFSTLSNISLSAGMLVPAFSPTTTTYTVNASADVPNVIATGIAMAPGIATISNNPATLSASAPSATIVCTSGDGLSSTTYTINFSPLTIDDWDANGATGAGSYPNMWGWANTSTAIPWNAANGGGGCRYRDNGLDGYTGFTNEDASPATSRQLMLRFDNGAYSASYYSYPVKLSACKTYDFDWDFVLGGSATPPNTITVGIDTTKTGAGRLSSKTFTTNSNQKIYRHGKYTFSTGSRGGLYYITINAGVAGWYGISNIALTENTTETLGGTTPSLFFDESNYQKTFLVTGNALTNDITLVAPAGITLDKTTIAKADAQCGVTVTATFNKAATSKDTIRITCGSLSQKIGVITSADSKCFTPLYSDRTNLVTDPFVNEITKFAGWGAKSIYYNPDSAYCGGSSGLISGGSLDVVLTGLLKTNTRYRVRAMVKAATTNAQVGVYGWSQAQATKDSVQNATIIRSWSPIDFIFKTDAELETTGQGIFFNNSPGSYIDNWEMYALPTIGSVQPTIPDMVSTTGGPCRDSIIVFGTELAANINLTLSGIKASLFSINKNTITQTSGKADSTKIIITYSPSAVSAGDTATLTVSSTEAQSVIFTLVGSTLSMPTIGTVETTLSNMVAKIGNTDKDTITVFGTELNTDITLAISGGKASLFSVDKTTIPQINGKADSTKVIITYSPAIVSAGDTAILTISSTYAANKVFSLVGSALTTSVKPLISDGITVLNRNGMVTVKINGKTGMLTLFDITGKMVLKQIVTTSEQTVNIAKAGIYVLKIESDGIIKTVKVVKTY